MRSILVFATLIWWDVGLATVFPRYGLAPTPYSLARSEALTAAKLPGLEALYYNPAALAHSDVNVGVVGVEGAADEVSITKSQEVDKEDDQVEQVFSRVSAGDPVYVDVVSRVLDIALPYFAVNSFYRVLLESQSPIMGESDLYQTEMNVDFGAILGFAVGYKGYSIGYSSYLLRRTGLTMTPSEAQMSTIKTAIDADSFNEETVDFRDFSTVTSGGAQGGNLGLMARPFEGNIFAIGLSVLNMGGTKFEDTLPLENSQYDELEKDLDEAANVYSIDKSLPDDIPEIVNVGLNVGIGGTDEDIAKAELSLDYNDVGGSSIVNKFAASTEFGLSIPDILALKTSVQIAKYQEKLIHMGLSSITVQAGARPGSYSSYGGVLGFHFGYEKKVSLIKLNVSYYNNTFATDGDPLVVSGVKAAVGLTLIF